MTSIGDGLQKARGQFPMAGTNPRAILLLTDGLENTSPWISGVDLQGIDVHVIGLGSESSLDEPKLTALTTAHGGQYVRAAEGLTLEKYFSNAFGNLLESGVLFDPEFDLPADVDGDPVPFEVCGEEALTVVIGWDAPDADLNLEVTTPAGEVLTASTPNVRDAAGRTWAFLNLRLPIAGERDGGWSARVTRPRGGGEFPPPTPPLRYFMNVIPTGGPKLYRTGSARL
jgi:hypothetical protein